MTAYLKAFVAALIAGLSVILAAYEGADALTAEDYVKAVFASLTALAAVWAVPNIKKG